MTIFDRYIIKTLLASIFLSLFAILSLYGFIALADSFKFIGRGTFNVYDAFYSTALSMPRRMYDLFPFSVLLGAITGLGTLNSNKELIAIRAAGVSIQRILIPVVFMAIILTIFMFMIGEYVIPVTEKVASKHWTQQVHGVTSNVSEETVWVREKNNFIKFNTLLNDDTLRDINIYSFNDDKTLKVHSYAQSAYYDDQNWILKNVRQVFFTENKIVRNEIELAKWPTFLDSEIIETIRSELFSLSASGLYHYALFLERNHLNNQKYWLLFWNKIFSPLSIAAMLLLAVPLAFNSSRTANQGVRLIISVAIGVSYTLINKIVGQFGLIYNIPSFICAGLVTILCLLLAFFLIKRIF